MNEFPWLEVFLTILALGSSVLAYFKLFAPMGRRIKKWIETWESFMQDWGGEEARPGRDRVPGVMERLNDIDGELKRNGGSSIKDSVDRIETNVNEIVTTQNSIKKRLEDGDKRFNKIEKRLDDLEDNK